MRKTLSDRGVAALKPRPRRYAHPDPELAGLFVRVQPSGAKTYVAVARSPASRQIWTTIGAADVLAISEARARARDVIQRVRDGLPAVETKPDSVTAVASSWIKRHVEPNGLRTQSEIMRLLNSHILPAWRDRAFHSIKRSDITALMDRIEDKHGARTADQVLTIFTSIATWHAKRVDDYASPIIRGMKRQSGKEQARDRILNDDEIRMVWKAAEATDSPLGPIIRLCLLTAQRRTKIASMKLSAISINGEWSIPKEDREKDNAGVLKLPEAALAIIKAQPRVGDNPYVFPGRGTDSHFRGFGQCKAQFDAKLPAMPNWTLHDCRRTARSLMSRAGVRPDVAERVLGHAVAGVEGVYDRHRYDAEKAGALATLAATIDSIIHPRPANVVAMKKGKRR